ncbi:MAG: DNA photolyase family protein [Rickettsiaceae bacterium]|nr:DNA photolyase family protein [Rickettsiaceae bacterium]
MSLTIHWFRQDLRLSDNPSLSAAVKNGDVLPIYILDDYNPGHHIMGEASRVWLHYSLNKLNESLGCRLRVFSGNATEIILGLTQKYEIKSVYWNRCYEPWQIKRDKVIKDVLQKQNIDVKSFNGSLMIEPWELLKGDKTPYKVFTAFYKKAYLLDYFISTPILRPNNDHYTEENIDSIDIESLGLLPSDKWGSMVIKGWEVGEVAAYKKLQSFLESDIKNYKEGRNFPYKKNVSCLSPHLHFGEISPRQICYSLQLLNKEENIECFLQEIGWREFSYYLLYHFPNIPTDNLNPKFDRFPWSDNKDLLSCWQKGATGIPIVDAGMRELWQTGYMHNRVRMIVGSFLVKNLLIHWNHGEQWFWNCLFDADLANNSCSWQWVAGCGADAAPYFRIFNPVMQGKKFDATGEYTRQYVPELKLLPHKYLFNPWEAPKQTLIDAGIQLGINYPEPIVDLAVSRKRALEIFSSL